MDNSAKIPALLLELYRAAQQLPVARFQEHVLQMLKPELGFDSAMWGGGALTPEGGIVPHHAHLHNEAPSMLEDWAEISASDLVIKNIIRYPGRALTYHLPTVFAGHGFAAARDYAKRHGHSNILCAGHGSTETGFVTGLSLRRAKAEHVFEEPQRALLEALTPHLIEALAINRRLHLEHLYTADRSRSSALAIADQRAALCYLGPRFEETVELEWPGWRGPYLPAPLIEAFLAHGRDAYAGKAVAFSVVHAGTLLFIKARRPSALEALSKRERVVAEQFGSGLSYRAIAGKLGISGETVRNHIANIYAKLNIRSKAELARIVARGE